MSQNDGFDTNETVSFGPFRLVPSQRLIERDGSRIQIGDRALDLLIALVEQAGDVVDKTQLINRVWPGVIVDESNLRVHVAALRKALGDGKLGARYIANIQGRGYAFVAPISSNDDGAPTEPEASPDLTHNLPASLRRMVGHSDTIRALAGELEAQRFVSIVGPGGIGKTTVAVTVGHSLLAEFGGMVRFVDLGTLSNPALVGGTIASALGISLQSDDPIPGLIKFLRNQRALLILDSCEHVIDAASSIAERIFQEAPAMRILTTSREALRVEGEYVFRLLPLECPPDNPDLTAAEIAEFPAVQLFVQRAAASEAGFILNDNDAATVGEICRKLDGIALAIELTAGRVPTFAVREITALLSKRFELLWQGRRTALPRHQTLHAALEWSFDLLSNLETLMFQRLSVFVGIFTLEAVLSVMAEKDVSEADIAEAFTALVAKSLVAVDTTTGLARYRLLDTTRAYAREKLPIGDLTETLARRHATYYREFLEKIVAQAGASTNPEEIASYKDHIGNVRAALQWCFSAAGDAELGAAVALASAPLFMAVSPMAECRYWTRQAISALTGASRGTPRELELQELLGLTLIFTKGNRDEARAAFTRGLEIADTIGDSAQKLHLINSLYSVLLFLDVDVRNAYLLAQRSEVIAKDIGDPASKAFANSLLGLALHHMGRQAAAQPHIEAGVMRVSPSVRLEMARSGYSMRNQDLCTFARILWLRGNGDKAIVVAQETIAEAEAMGHPVILCILLVFLTPVFLWGGDYLTAQALIRKLMNHAEKQDLAFFYGLGLGFLGELQIKQGNLASGIQLLRDYSLGMSRDGGDTQSSEFLDALAHGLMLEQKFEEALDVANQAIERASESDNLLYLSELLRTRASILVARPLADEEEAEKTLLRAIGLAQSQSALAWELRAATNLALLRYKQGRRGAAKDVLEPVYRQFTEGFAAPDLLAAKRVLQEIG
jgi:predicted ATPase/DNA-binding winged helix-turn-helix (wHTH) protein